MLPFCIELDFSLGFQHRIKNCFYFDVQLETMFLRKLSRQSPAGHPMVAYGETFVLAPLNNIYHFLKPVSKFQVDLNHINNNIQPSRGFIFPLNKYKKCLTQTV